MSGPIPKTNVNRESRYHYQVNTIKSRNLKSRNEDPEKKGYHYVSVKAKETHETFRYGELKGKICKSLAHCTF